MDKKVESTIRFFIPFAIVITLFCGIVYATVQQTYRQNANDPQVQLVEDAVDNLDNQGANPMDLNSLRKVDINKSLGTFYIVVDNNKKVVASNAVLSGKTPTPPSGIFDALSEKEAKDIASVKKRLVSKLEGGSAQNRVTWQPDSNTRIAAVVGKYSGGYVLVGKNLREVESREESLTHMIALGWVATLVLTFLSILLLDPILNLINLQSLSIIQANGRQNIRAENSRNRRTKRPSRTR